MYFQLFRNKTKIQKILKRSVEVKNMFNKGWCSKTIIYGCFSVEIYGSKN